MEISIKIEGIEKLAAGAAAAPATLESEVKVALVAGSLLIEGAARGLAPKDTGRLAGSITHNISGLTSRIGPSAGYGLFVEMGRSAGKPPPVSAVAGWAARHGVNPYVLARSIGRRGTRKRPFMKPAFESNVGRVTALFVKVGARVVARMAGG